MWVSDSEWERAREEGGGVWIKDEKKEQIGIAIKDLYIFLPQNA